MEASSSSVTSPPEGGDMTATGNPSPTQPSEPIPTTMKATFGSSSSLIGSGSGGGGVGGGAGVVAAAGARPPSAAKPPTPNTLSSSTRRRVGAGAAAGKTRGGPRPAASYDISIGAWQGQWSRDIGAVCSVSSYAAARYFVTANRIDIVECKNLEASSSSAAGVGGGGNGSSSALPPIHSGGGDAATAAAAAYAHEQYLSKARTLDVHVAEVGSIDLAACGLRPSQKLLSMHTFTIDGSGNGNSAESTMASSSSAAAPAVAGYFNTNPNILPKGTYLLCLLKDDSSHYILLFVTPTNKLTLVGRGRLGEGKDFFATMLHLAGDGEAHGDPSAAKNNEYFRPSHFTVFGFPSPHYGLGYDADSGEYVIVSLVNLVLGAAAGLRQQHPSAYLPPSVDSALAAFQLLERGVSSSGSGNGRSQSPPHAAAAAAANADREDINLSIGLLPMHSSSSSGGGGGQMSTTTTTTTTNTNANNNSNVRTAIIIQRGFFDAEWTDLMWKGSPHRYSTRQKFFCYNAVSGACGFECVRVDRRYVLLAEGEAVSFPMLGDRAQMSSDGGSDTDTAVGGGNASSAAALLSSGDEGGGVVGGGEGGDSTTGPTSPPPQHHQHRSLDARMAAHRRSIALVGTERLAARRRGCLLIPLNLNKQVGCLLYSHTYLSVPHSGRSSGVVPRIGFSSARRRAGGTSLDDATAMLQKRIFAHDEPWTSCVFLTNHTHNSNSNKHSNHAGANVVSSTSSSSSSISQSARSFLLTYSQHSGVVWISQIYQIAKGASRKGADAALPNLLFAAASSSSSMPHHNNNGTGTGNNGAATSSSAPLPNMAPSPTRQLIRGTSPLDSGPSSRVGSANTSNRRGGGGGVGSPNRRATPGGSPLLGSSGGAGSSSPPTTHRRGDRPSSGRARLEQWRQSPTGARSGRDVHLYDEGRDEVGRPYSVTSRYSIGGGVGISSDEALLRRQQQQQQQQQQRQGQQQQEQDPSGHDQQQGDNDADAAEEDEGSGDENANANNSLRGGGGGEDTKEHSTKASSSARSGGVATLLDGSRNTANLEGTTNTLAGVDDDEAEEVAEVDPNRPSPIKLSLAALLAAAANGGGAGDGNSNTKGGGAPAVITDSDEVTQMLANRRKMQRLRGSYGDEGAAGDGGGSSSPRSRGVRGSQHQQQQHQRTPKPPPRHGNSPLRNGNNSNRRSPHSARSARGGGRDDGGGFDSRDDSPLRPRTAAAPTKPRGPRLRSGEVRNTPPPERGAPSFMASTQQSMVRQRSKPTASSSDANYDEHGRRRTKKKTKSGGSDDEDGDGEEGGGGGVDAHEAAAERRRKMYSYQIPSRPKSSKPPTTFAVADGDADGGAASGDEDGSKHRFHRRLKSSTPRLTRGRSPPPSSHEEAADAKGDDDAMNTTVPTTTTYRAGASRPMFESGSGGSRNSKRLAAFPATTDNFHNDIIAIINHLKSTGQIPAVHSKAIERALEKVDDMEEGDDDGGIMERPEYKHAGVVIATPWRGVAPSSVSGGIVDAHRSMASAPDRHSELAKFDKKYAKHRENDIPTLVLSKAAKVRLIENVHDREAFQAQQIKKMLTPHQKIVRETKYTYENKDRHAPEAPIDSRAVTERLATADVEIRAKNRENRTRKFEKERAREITPAKQMDKTAYEARFTKLYEDVQRHETTMEKLIRNRDREERKGVIGLEHKPLSRADEKALSSRLIDQSIKRREAERAEILKEMDKPVLAHQVGRNYNDGKGIGPEEAAEVSQRLWANEKPYAHPDVMGTFTKSHQ